MQSVGARYVKYINHTYRRSGTLWEGRYKASVIDSDAWLLTCMRYIELNPVRAGMVDHPSAYRWSSYRTNARGEPGSILSPHALYQALGRAPAERQYAYRALFSCGLDADALHEIRSMVNEELVLGCEDFRNRIAQMTRRQVRRGRNGRPRLPEEAK